MSPLLYAACLAAVAVACMPPAHGQVVAHGEFELGSVERSTWLAPAVFVAAGAAYSVIDWHVKSPRKIGDPGFRWRWLAGKGIGGAVLGLAAFGAVEALGGYGPYESLLAGEGGHVKTGSLAWAAAVACMLVAGVDFVRREFAALVSALSLGAEDPAAPDP